jgi:hypothetical protein
MPRPFNPLTAVNTAFNKSRCQARFRKEEWDPAFTFREWWRIWQPCWDLRGRRAEDWIMVRVDPTLPWSEHNVALWVRRDWLREVNLRNTHRLGFRKFDKA